MAKTKNKKRISSDDVHKPKGNFKSKLNPFEVHINKEKMKVLGKKTKNDRGLPGISRAKGIQKRKETLLQEYKHKHKSNYFKDRRLGEQNKLIEEEDKITARFTAVRKRSHKRSIFNLADDEILTHKGTAITEIDKFDDPRSDDEDSFSGDKGILGSDFVENAHFGGGIFTNTNKEGTKTHKEIIDDLIAESKKRKAEKQKAKEATLELTEKLDAEWRDLMPLMAENRRKDENEDKPKLDDYDKLARQLKFEAKIQASDRLKTEDEVAKEEKEKLEELERERLNRMKGFADDAAPKVNHKSADDLDDDFVYDSEPDEERMLTYNEEGEANVEIDAQFKGKHINTNKNFDPVEEQDKTENEDQEEEEESEKGSENDADSDEQSESEDGDNLSDLKAEDSGSEDDDNVGITTKSIHIQNNASVDSTRETGKRKSDTDMEGPGACKKRNVSKETYSLEENSHNELQAKIKEDLLRRKEMMENARKELPYTFNLPATYEEFEDLFQKYSCDHQCVIIERMIKCYHPSLGEGNKQKLTHLFSFLLQYLNDLACSVDEAKSVKTCFEKLAALAPQIFDLAQFNKENTHHALLEVIKEKHEDFKKRPKLYPGLENLIFFKLVSLLFPTSDFRHQIVTPCIVFIEQMLTRCRVKSRRDISYGLFITTLVLEYTSLSKRFLPAVINFLGGLLHMAIPKVSIRIVKVMPPFRTMASDLVLSSKHQCDNLELKMSFGDLTNSEINDDFKIRTIYTVLKLLGEFSVNFKGLSSNIEIFNPILRYIESIPLKNYPQSVQKEFESLVFNLHKNKTERKLQYVAMEVKRPKVLRLYEPKIEEVYDGKKRRIQSKEKATREKLIHKLKRETKGALREIRRDQSFLGRVKIKQNLESEKERKAKVKKIFAEAAMQQSELNALDRAKKKKK